MEATSCTITEPDTILEAATILPPESCARNALGEQRSLGGSAQAIHEEILQHEPGLGMRLSGPSSLPQADHALLNNLHSHLITVMGRARIVVVK